MRFSGARLALYPRAQAPYPSAVSRRRVRQHYVQALNAKPGTVAFTTEAIENIPPGYRARETYVLHGSDEFEEVFELAKPGKEFTVYSRTRLKRVR